MAGRFICKFVQIEAARSMLIASHAASLNFGGGHVGGCPDGSGSDDFHQHACNVGLLIDWHDQAILELHEDPRHCSEDE